MAHFVDRLISPRSSFPADMSPDERTIMGEHAAYWRGLLAGGSVVVYGPVADPAGVWGLAVVDAPTAADVEAIGRADPAVSSNLCTFSVYPMLTTQLHPALTT